MYEPLWSANETDYLRAWREYTEGWVFRDLNEEAERYDDFVAGFVAGGLAVIESVKKEVQNEG